MKYEPALVGSAESSEKAELVVRHLEKARGFKREPPGSIPVLHTAFAGGKAWLVSGLMPYDDEEQALPGGPAIPRG